MRKLLIVAMVFSTIFASDSFISTAQGADEVQGRKVDIAGRQRMLTQRMAKAACFIGSYSEVDKHHAMLIDASKLFDDSLKTLTNGNPSLNIPAETEPSILAELENVKPYWHMLDFATRILIESPETPGLDVNMIEQFNLPALKQSNAVVQTMERAYYKGTKSTGSVRAINVAGRQRMLSQKAAKEFCFISYGLDVEKNRQALKKTIQDFDIALDDLRNGDSIKNIPPAPTINIRYALTQLKSDWQSPRGIYLAIANGVQAHDAEFSTISKSNDQMLKQSNEIVGMMVNYYKNMETR
ncbi:conserved exported hypothetical protein [Candidatus Terasakiella magnetica]|uniref:NarX-like N-terminal domain-containing protein n=1 Tax=Candidatus Terasakiella magnetica TaxID=1867952 RepID=A0A1C3RIH9_9PROT|nr:type IV pili methyl-accepting chemotaxis transducer N-terminal domain-containing protein [Candidatus Terasakiella magnetica]SCA57055.1 conserved exported hypothetical protein [Candidatus Terasakiella magnetica]